MKKILSWYRVNEMKKVFEHLNKVPIETRRGWGFHYRDYTFAVRICDVLLERMERESKRVKISTERNLNLKGLHGEALE
jgi:hypothetical protein